MVHKADRLKTLQFVSDVLNEGSNLVVDNLGIAFVRDLANCLLHLSVEVNPDLL